MALGIILGPMIEENLGKCFHLSKAEGSLWNVFFSSPISIVLIVLTALSVATPYLLEMKRKRQATCAAEKDSVHA
jgi:putative tricarboxylic transport membrane protein